MLERTKEKLKNGEKLVFVAFGDSITEGFGVREGWPPKLVGELKKKYPDANIELINSGRSGDTAEDGLFRIEQGVIGHAPHLVSINFGINDAFCGVSLAAFENTIKEMITVIQTKLHCDIIVLSSEVLEDEAADKLARKYFDKLQKVSRDANVTFVDMHRIWHTKLREGANLSSLLIPGLDHPNEEGYKVFARAIAEIV